MTEAGVRQHLDALAENGLVRSRTKPSEGSRPATDGVGAHRSRAGSVPRPSRRPHRRPDHRGAYRARRRGVATCHRRARRTAARGIRQGACPNVVRCGPRPRRWHACGRKRAISRKSSTIPTVAECCSSSTTARSARRRRPARDCAVGARTVPRSHGPEGAIERTQHILDGDRRCTYRIDPRR